ncbi:hypothetical protein [Acidipropionibacterium timonense]|uniref:hypothetical protein n=1 Tax=Acidipropionibacterium timonense TaxID=2161818 RepID=UPI00102FA9AA|nr:hypothetical protein [Acidipropionibacterium timonense]
MSIPGRVSMVTTVEAGGVVTGWSGVTMAMVDASGLAVDAGTISLDGGVTTIGYTDVTWGETDTDPDLLTTAVSAPAGWVPDGGEQWAQVWPPAVDIIAAVQLYDGTDVRAIVPHSLRAVLPDGNRDDDEAESVTVDLQDGRWTVTDVVGRRAQIPMSALSSEVTVAIASASGRNTNTYSLNSPDGSPVGNRGDAWFQLDSNGHTIGMWHSDGTTWQADTIDGTALANLDAGTITSGSLSGIDVWSPSPTALPRVHVGSATVEVLRDDGDGSAYASTSLGGASDDHLFIYDVAGIPVAGFGSDGSGVAGDMAVNGTLTVAGTDIMDTIAALPQGIVFRQKLGSTSSLNNLQFGNTELGLLEFDTPLHAGRVYRFVVQGGVWTSAADQIYLRLRMTSDVGGAPSPVTTGAAQLDMMSTKAPGGNTYTYWESILPVQQNDTTVRLLLSAHMNTFGVYGRFSSTDTHMANIYLEDMGSYGSWGDGQENQGGGTPYGSSSAGTAPTGAAVQTYTRRWNAAYTRTWQGSTVVTSDLQQGSYGGTRRYSVLLWGGAPSTELSSGGVHISRMRLYLRNTHWYYSAGGYARIGHYDDTSLPSSPQTSGGGAFTTSLWGVGAARWVDIPSGWWSGIANGTIRGFTLGEGAGTDLTYFGRFSNAPSDVSLEVTYTK